MNVEENRLRSFNSWPSNGPNAAELAKSGFYSVGLGVEVQCFSCGGKISDWHSNEPLEVRHRRLDPHCPFLINPAACGNVPRSVPQQRQPLSSREISAMLQTENSRLRTYTDWPITHIVAPETLARAGFYSIGQGDKVKCAYCQGVVGFWESGDDPKNEHRRHFPACPFVLANFDNNNIFTSGTRNLQELGIQTHRGPRQPRYATVESRVRTYLNWPADLIQTPEMLSEAGFYYVGVGDHVRCFHCDGGLRHWEPDDEPWIEHAKWFSECAFMRLVKGQDFIDSCLAVDDATSRTESRPDRSTPSSHLSPSTVLTTSNSNVSEADIQAHLRQAPALAALSIGLQIDRVKQAIRLKLEQTGTGYVSSDSLIEDALNLQLEEGDTDPEDVGRILSSVLMQHQSRGDGPSTTKSHPHTTPQFPMESSSSKNLSLEEENRILKEARLCKICMDSEIGVVFLPCGHLTTCVNCAPSLKDCPVCRGTIKATVRTFMS